MITGFSRRRQTGNAPTLGDLDPENKTDVLKSTLKHLRTATREPIVQPRDLISLIVTQCLGILLDNTNRLEGLDFLMTFSEQAANVLDKTTKLLQMFVKSFENYGSKSEIPTEVFEIIFSVTKETLLFREVQDLRDELGMLSSLFNEQLQVLEDIEKYDVEMPGLALSISRVKKHGKDAVRMQEQAAQAYDMLKDLLNLKQQQANVLEARQAGKQAVIAGKQGKVVLVFTVVTIIFLPLTFMTTVFTLNLSSFHRIVIPPTDILPATTALDSGYVFGINVGVAIAMALPLVILAFNVDEIYGRFVRTRLYKRVFPDPNADY